MKRKINLFHIEYKKPSQFEQYISCQHCGGGLLCRMIKDKYLVLHDPGKMAFMLKSEQ